MQQINRKSPQVIANNARVISRSYVVIDEGKFYFTAAMSRFLSLRVGLYIHFLNEGAEWNFYINSDEDGFKLTPVTNKGGFHITNSGLTKMVLKSMGYKTTKRLTVENTETQLEGMAIYRLSDKNVPTTYN